MVKSFYEPYWIDKRIVKKNMDEAKILEGRIFFDKEAEDRHVGFVKLDPIPLPKENEDDETKYLPMQYVKVFGIRQLNRVMHLDKVYIKFVDWIYWGNAGPKLTKNIDFNEYDKFEACAQREMENEYLRLQSIHEEKTGSKEGFVFDD